MSDDYPLPSAGGRYVRDEKGNLTRVDETPTPPAAEPAPAPAKEKSK